MYLIGEFFLALSSFLFKNENILQVVAAPHQDRLCLAVAKELGEKFGGWVPPP